MGRFVRAFAVLACVAINSWAAPGGYVVDGISDECATLSPIWGPGLRGMPESLTFHNGAMSIRSVDNGDDPYPSAEDMTSTHSEQIGRSIASSEGPSVVATIWLPPFSEWPTGVNAIGEREWFGFRVTAYDPNLSFNNGLYFPGIFISTDDDGPCLRARVGDGYTSDITIGRIGTDGWWTLGLSWNEQGRTEYYASSGQVVLTNGHLLHTDLTYQDPAANRSIAQLVGNFFALRLTYPPTGQLSPNWMVDFIRIHVRTAPALPSLIPSVEGGQFRLHIIGCARGFRYLLQQSDDLENWSTVEEFVSDGADRIFFSPLAGRQFFRVTLPAPVGG
jgi:hypothetical protein